MNMRRARRLCPSGGGSFRTWVRDVWKKFGELAGDGNAEGKLAAVLGLPRAPGQSNRGNKAKGSPKGK